MMWTAPEETQPTPPKSVLIVDDTPANLGVLSSIFSGGEYAVAVAENGEEALSQIQYNPPEIVLLDVMMPGIDGFETCRRLRAMPATREIPVVFMTALGDSSMKVKGFEAGGNDYITKPFDNEEVIARVSALVELRRAQQRAFRREVDLRARDAAEAARIEFLSIVSHELRTPLNAISGFAQLLRETALRPEQQEFVRYILNGSETLSRLIEEVVNFASMTGETSAVRAQPVDFASIMTNLATEFAPPAESKGLRFRLQIDPDLPAPLLADAQLFLRIFRNLVSNAIKFTPIGEVRVALEVDGLPVLDGVSGQSGGVLWPLRFVVEDTGIGIATEKIPLIFRPFSQADYSIRRQYEGTGLGLAIVDRLARRLQAEVTVTSTPGVGSTFAVLFRLPQVD